MEQRKRPYDGDDSVEKKKAAGGQIIKLLCPDGIVGSVIGKGGEEIKSIKAKTNAIINVSKAGQNFPGTSERPIAIKADKSAMMDVIVFVQEKIYESEKADEERKQCIKLVVPDTSIGRIIGRGGDTVKRLRATWSIELSPTSKGETPEDLDERVVSLAGEWDNCLGCLDEILDMIVNDPKSVMELELDYSQWESFVPKEDVKRQNKVESSRGGYRGAAPRAHARGMPFSGPKRGPPRPPMPPMSRGGPRGAPRGVPRGSYRSQPPRGGDYDYHREDPYEGSYHTRGYRARGRPYHERGYGYGSRRPYGYPGY